MFLVHLPSCASLILVRLKVLSEVVCRRQHRDSHHPNYHPYHPLGALLRDHFARGVVQADKVAATGADLERLALIRWRAQHGFTTSGFAIIADTQLAKVGAGNVEAALLEVVAVHVDTFGHRVCTGEGDCF